MNGVTISTGLPVVTLLAEQRLHTPGVMEMAHWVRSHRPECVPESGFADLFDLLPHGPIEGVRWLTDNELLVEIAGRKCYDSFAEKAAKRSNADYIRNTQSGPIKHASIMYHAKMTFFIAGISRRVTHELIRNYVGADRDEEGCPSQESTRFTYHYGWFVAPPRIVGNEGKLAHFRAAMQRSYDDYRWFIDSEVEDYIRVYNAEPKGLARKRIYEAASAYLDHSAETSLVWTTNPVALTKLFIERGGEEADEEFRRLVNQVWKPLALQRAPNLFPALT